MQSCLLTIERNWHWCETDTSALKKKKKKKMHFLLDGQKPKPKPQKSESKVNTSQISSSKNSKNFELLFSTLLSQNFSTKCPPWKPSAPSSSSTS